MIKFLSGDPVLIERSLIEGGATGLVSNYNIVAECKSKTLVKGV